MIVLEFSRGLSHKDLNLLGKKYCVNIQKTMTRPYHNTTHELFCLIKSLIFVVDKILQFVQFTYNLFIVVGHVGLV